MPVKPEEKNGRDEERGNMREAINRMKDEGVNVKIVHYNSTKGC